MSGRQNLAIFGAQWGDEGKGKIVDLICGEFDLVARYHGGHNAGHTVKFADRHYSLHLIPSGIIHPEKLCILGNGMVIDPKALLEEIDTLRAGGIVIEGNLRISESAHCILPIHGALDRAREAAAGTAKIGTTGRGIGPAYECKVSRQGVTMGDLLDESTLRERITMVCSEKNPLLATVYGVPAFNVEEMVQQCLRYGQIFRERITDTTLIVNDAIRIGSRVLFEGAQGSLLDIDHGTYPFVTSSNCVVGAVSAGLGVPPRAIHGVLAVAKAYTTRVGGGPFPSELLDTTGDLLRNRGNEFGTTTGRPRRTGWLDLVVLRTSHMLNGFDAVALTKLDVLDDFEEIPICIGYRVRGQIVRTLPARHLGIAEPVFQTFPGWMSKTVGLRDYDSLPPNAKAYVEFIENELDCPIAIVSTGPRREETIIRPNDLFTGE